MENKGECEVKTMGGYAEVFLYEFLGTMILVSTIAFQPVAGATPIVLSLFVAIITNNGKTGGHFNPAVTTAVLVGRKCWNKIGLVLLGYYLPQYLGGTAGVWLARLARNYPAMIQVNELMGYTVWDAWWVELWGTFLFTFNILSITHCTVKTDGTIKAMVVVMGLYVAVSIAGPVSGGGINPAVAFNLQLWAMIMQADNDFYHAFGQFWIYLAAPLCGAILSGGLYFCIHNVFDKLKAEHGGKEVHNVEMKHVPESMGGGHHHDHHVEISHHEPQHHSSSHHQPQHHSSGHDGGLGHGQHHQPQHH